MIKKTGLPPQFFAYYARKHKLDSEKAWERGYPKWQDSGKTVGKLLEIKKSIRLVLVYLDGDKLL